MRIDYRRPASLAFSTNHLVELAGATLAASMDQTTPMQIDETAAVDRTAAIQPMIATENDDLADRRQRTMTLLQNSDRISSTQKEILAKLIEVGDPAVLSSINIRFTDEEIVAVLENLARLQNSSCDIDNQIDMALRVIYKDADNKKKQNSAKSSFRHIRKIIEKVHKCPSDIKARRLLVKNFTFKKFISDVPGALELMKELGFVSVNEDCLEIDQNVDVDFLARTMVKLDQAASDMDAALASTSDDQGPRKPCVGNCGFFGNPDTEGFCSLCFRQKLSGKDPIVEKTECISDGCNNFGNPSKDHYCNKCWQEREDIKNAGWSNRSWWRPLQRAKLKLHAVWLFRQGRASRPVQLDLRKCWMCTRKVPLSAVACQCGYVFCSKHRSTLDHECTFNFRRAHKVHLHQLNPQIQGKKFDRLD